MLGVGVASTLFAIALLAAGQNSTLTGTLSGQIVMEGFLNFRMRPWLRRLVTRLIAIIPAVIGHRHLRRERGPPTCSSPARSCSACSSGSRCGRCCASPARGPRWGRFVNPPIIKVLGYTTALIIIGLNVKLLFDTFIPESWRIAIYGA